MSNNGETFPRPRKKYSEEEKDRASRYGFVVKDNEIVDPADLGHTFKSTREIQNKVNLREYERKIKEWKKGAQWAKPKKAAK